MRVICKYKTRVVLARKAALKRDIDIGTYTKAISGYLELKCVCICRLRTLTS